MDSVVVVALARRTYYGAGRVQKEMLQRQENSIGECDKIWGGTDAPSVQPP